MKKLVFLIIIIFIITGCSRIDENAYNDLLNKHNKNEEALEKYTDQVAEYENELKLSEDEIKRLNNSLIEARDNINDLEETNIALKNSRENQDIYTDYYTKHFEPVLAPYEAKSIIEKRSEEAIRLISEYDFDGLANMVHPIYGIRFTPYTFVYIDKNLVFYKDEIKNFENDEDVHIWGVYDGIGDDIELKPLDYFKKFVYDEDFADAEQISYNEIISETGWIENQFGMYHNSIIVEYYFSGFNPDFVGMDWTSLRIVFQKHENEWYITGVIHNQWTI